MENPRLGMFLLLALFALIATMFFLYGWVCFETERKRPIASREYRIAVICIAFAALFLLIGGVLALSIEFGIRGLEQRRGEVHLSQAASERPFCCTGSIYYHF